MAIAKPGPLVQAISGKLGSTVFADTRHGTVLKLQTRTRNQKLGESMEPRLRLVRAAESWNNLAQPLKDSWNQFGGKAFSTNRLGTKHALSGRDLYIRYTSLLTMTHWNTPLGPARGFWPAHDWNPTWTIGSHEARATFTWPSPDPDHTCVVVIAWGCRLYGRQTPRRLAWKFIGATGLVEAAGSMNWYGFMPFRSLWPVAGEKTLLKMTVIFRFPVYVNTQTYYVTVEY